MRLTDPTDEVVIGAFVPIGSEKLRVVGDERLEGCLSLVNTAVVPPPATREFSWCVEAATGSLLLRDVTGAADRYAVDAGTGNLVMRGDYDIVPSVDAQGELGTDLLRWGRIRGAQVIAGDLGFDDPTCAVCGQEFQVSQPILFKIRKIEGAVKLAVPVHDFCVRHEPK